MKRFLPLVVIAAEHYASRLVLPQSQQHSPLAWGSRQGKAVRALEKLAGPHIPVSLKQLEKAVKKAKAALDAMPEDSEAFCSGPDVRSKAQWQRLLSWLVEQLDALAPQARLFD